MNTAADVAYADTNVIVSLMAGPDHPTHDQAVNLLRRVAEGSLRLIMTPVVVAEIVFVLTRVFGWDRRETGVRLFQLLQADGLVVREESILGPAVALWARSSRLAFPDAYLAASAVQDGPPAVASFDRDFDGIEGLRRISA